MIFGSLGRQQRSHGRPLDGWWRTSFKVKNPSKKTEAVHRVERQFRRSGRLPLQVETSRVGAPVSAGCHALGG